MNNTVKTYAIKGLLENNKEAFITRLSLLLNEENIDMLMDGVISRCWFKNNNTMNAFIKNRYNDDIAHKEEGVLPVTSIKNIYVNVPNNRIEFSKVRGIRRYYKDKQTAERFSNGCYTAETYSIEKSEEYPFEASRIMTEYDSISMASDEFKKYFDYETV